MKATAIARLCLTPSSRLNCAATSRIAMPPKRNDRHAVSRLTSPMHDTDGQSEKQSSPQQAVTSSSSLPNKPCLCCGREITPRAKWARNWDAIRYCSEQCRAWRPVVSITTADESIATNGDVVSPENDMDEVNLLRACIEMRTSSTVSGRRWIGAQLHIDAWMEATLVLTAQRSAKPALRTLADVSQAMHRHIDTLGLKENVRSGIAALLQAKPGEREMIRRAARRLVVWPFSQSSAHLRFRDAVQSWAAPLSAPQHNLLFTQSGGRSALVTLTDVSYAKGEIELSIKQRWDV